MATNVTRSAGNRHPRDLRRRDQLVLAHTALAESIARGVARSLPPHFDLDDLISHAFIALVEAADRYQPETHNGTPFAIFARKIIRGAVIDSARRGNWIENNRPGLEVAEEGDGACGRAGLSLVDRVPTQPVAHERAERAQTRRRVAEAISWLPEAEQAVMREYYGADQPTYFEVAKRLGIYYEQAKQLHLTAIAEVRARMTGGAVRRRAA